MVAAPRLHLMPRTVTGDAPRNTFLHGDCLEVLRTLPDECVQCVVTSPPYFGLRDYGVEGQIGLEPTPDEYIAAMVRVFREVRRVLRADGVVWLNIGDSYNSGMNFNHDRSGLGNASRYAEPGKRSRPMLQGYKPKDLLMIPARVALALQADGWYLRAECVWAKPNPMPESVRDRPTRSHEMLYLLTKSARYFYDADAVREPLAYPEQIMTTPGRGRLGDRRAQSARDTGRSDGFTRPLNNAGNPAGRNKRDVWTVATAPYKGAHFATMPPRLVEPCILAGSRRGDIVLDPFSGAGTVALVARQHMRDWLGIELNADYIALAEERLSRVQLRLV